jgi:hypothetical protein
VKPQRLTLKYPAAGAAATPSPTGKTPRIVVRGPGSASGEGEAKAEDASSPQTRRLILKGDVRKPQPKPEVEDPTAPKQLPKSADGLPLPTPGGEGGFRPTIRLSAYGSLEILTPVRRSCPIGEVRLD